MKSFLTFTLAAGVAISTSSISHAEGVGRKGASPVTNNESAVQRAPVNAVTLRGPLLDRRALERELSRLSVETLQVEEDGSFDVAPKINSKSSGVWTY